MEWSEVFQRGFAQAAAMGLFVLAFWFYRYMKPKVKKAGSIAKEKNNQGLNLGKFNFAISDLIILILVIVAVIFLLIMN